MKSDAFWSVELGVRMGPLVLGTEYEPLLQILREHRIDVDQLRLDRSGKLSIQEFRTQLVFSGTHPRTLYRIDVDDERIRFGPLPVIGKRVHEIIGMFKVSRKETLWCSVEPNGESSVSAGVSHVTADSREQLARGTIWIPSLGLGLTLCDGLIATVHLCDPEQAPQQGSGPWTKEQQLLSEVRELPAASTVATSQPHRKFILSSLIHIMLVLSIVTLMSWTIHLQQKWNAAPEVLAVVVGLDPPPPHPLPEKITVSFHDFNGMEQRHTLGYKQFEMTPRMGDEVNVRYLTEAPNKVLGSAASRTVGIDSAFPYGIGILAAYSVIQLLVFGSFPFRSVRKI